MRPVILLDGAMATQLSARGFELRGPLVDRTTPSPGFSARALLDQPELVAAIHHDYLRAGAQVLTTNSFGLHASTLAEAGIAHLQGPLVARSVEILTAVRHAVRQHEPELARFRVAGSIPPRPHTDWSGEPELAAAQYRGLAEQLALAGADLILLETFTTCAEARLALAGVAELGLPIWLSIVAGAPTVQRQPDGTRLIGGEPIAELAPLLDQVDALLLNCTQIDAVPAALDALAQLGHAHPTLPLGLSPHFGKRRHDGVWVERIVDSDPFAGQIQAWLERPSRARFELIGACCGSTPQDIASVRARLQADRPARELGWTRLAELVP